MDSVRAAQVMDALAELYPEARPELNFSNPFETLIATILSAQCTDKRVNLVSIVAASRALVEQYAGRVPDTREELMKLPGVGRKTAGVVLMAAFGDAQIPVDTHVFRLSHRIGLADGSTPEKVEMQLRALLPREIWTFGHHLLIWHGRRVCFARNPDCAHCPLAGGLCERNMEKETE